MYAVIKSCVSDTGLVSAPVIRGRGMLFPFSVRGFVFRTCLAWLCRSADPDGREGERCRFEQVMMFY